jgi:hypothetical protein
MGLYVTILSSISIEERGTWDSEGYGEDNIKSGIIYTGYEGVELISCDSGKVQPRDFVKQQIFLVL